MTWEPSPSQQSDFTPRAVDFLRVNAQWVDGDFDRAEDVRAAGEAAECFGLDREFVLGGLGRIRAKVGGLRYHSPSWSFEERIGFYPVIDFDPDDHRPMMALIEHSVAHPFGVWATLDGEVAYMYPNVDGGEYVTVFDRVESLIESDALHSECLGWSTVQVGGIDTFAIVGGRSAALALIREASGHTESWWQGDGFRLHMWRTMAEVYGRPELVKWAVWAQSPQGVDAARLFIEGVNSGAY